MFLLSKSKFEQAIAATPDSVETILTYAKVLRDQALRNPHRVDWQLMLSAAVKSLSR